MKFINYKDGSCDIKFSLKERFTLLIKGKITFTSLTFKHFINHFGMMIANWQLSLPKDIQKVMSNEDSKIDGE
jgi:hypothetical protein